MGSNPPVRPYGQEPLEDGSSPVPEILPPADRQIPPAQPRPHRRWAMAPATYALVGINCAVFLLMAFGGTNPLKPNSDNLLFWGANNAGAVLLYGQWWRIVTAMFVHGGLLHLALNMWCLWNLGLLAEPLMGSLGVVAVYILTGAAGNLLSTLVNWWPYRTADLSAGGLIGPVGVGASGAVFGIAGALIILLKSPRLPVPAAELSKLRRSVIYFAAINLIIGFSINVGTSVIGAGIGVDNMAHLGGCASGLLFAVPMVPRLGSPRRTFDLRLRIAIGMLTGILVLFGFFLSALSR